MQDKVVLITGGTGGIGRQTALTLARLGAQLVVTGRSEVSGAAAVAEIVQTSGNPGVTLLLADLATQADVRALAKQFKVQHRQLDVLINNAGQAASHRQLTADGIEANFAVNVVAPFLLTYLLMDSLQASSSARVINLTGGDVPAKLDLDNLQAERSFDGLNSYSQSKLAMMAVMYEFAQRTQGSQVSVNVCYPGQASTNMTRSVTPEMFPRALRVAFPLFQWLTRPDDGKSAAKASRSSVYLASAAEVTGVTGRYFSAKCKPAAWPAAVLDAQTRQQLWTTVARLAGVTPSINRQPSPSSNL